MTHEVCESKLGSVLRSSVHPYPGNWVAVGHAVIEYAWAAREFSAGIKCQHCSKRTIQSLYRKDYVMEIHVHLLS